MTFSISKTNLKKFFDPDIYGNWKKVKGKTTKTNKDQKEKLFCCFYKNSFQIGKQGARVKFSLGAII